VDLYLQVVNLIFDLAFTRTNFSISKIDHAEDNWPAMLEDIAVLFENNVSEALRGFKRSRYYIQFQGRSADGRDQISLRCDEDVSQFVERLRYMAADLVENGERQESPAQLLFASSLDTSNGSSEHGKSTLRDLMNVDSYTATATIQPRRHESDNFDQDDSERAGDSDNRHRQFQPRSFQTAVVYSPGSSSGASEGKQSEEQEVLTMERAGSLTTLLPTSPGYQQDLLAVAQESPLPRDSSSAGLNIDDLTTLSHSGNDGGDAGEEEEEEEDGGGEACDGGEPRESEAVQTDLQDVGLTAADEDINADPSSQVACGVDPEEAYSEEETEDEDEDEKTVVPFFVYGSLRRHQHNHKLLHDRSLSYIGTTVTSHKFFMYVDKSTANAVISATPLKEVFRPAKNVVVGEVYHLTLASVKEFAHLCPECVLEPIDVMPIDGATEQTAQSADLAVAGDGLVVAYVLKQGTSEESDEAVAGVPVPGVGSNMVNVPRGNYTQFLSARGGMEAFLKSSTSRPKMIRRASTGDTVVGSPVVLKKGRESRTNSIF
jgi:gamma-glutamylcyclotransferase (GGCT)/AIG2-like uncharacterized protein YtfP